MKENKDKAVENTPAINQNIDLSIFDNENNQMLKDYTSELVKLEKGEVLKGIIERNLESLTDKEGKPYECLKIHEVGEDFEENKVIVRTVLMSGNVLLSAYEKMFKAHEEKQALPVIITGLGEVMSANKRTYTNYSVKSI